MPSVLFGVLTANNPISIVGDFDKEKRIFLNYWKAICSNLDDGDSETLYKYGGVELFCRFSIPFFMKLQESGKFTVPTMEKLLKDCFENVDGDYAGVGHPDWWKTGGQAGRLNAGALGVVSGNDKSTAQGFCTGSGRNMNSSELVPQPTHCELFKRSRERSIPEKCGCYVLTTFLRVVLYVGLADNLRRRMNDHLDDPIKVGETRLGRAVLFHWIESEDTNKIERTWMNTHMVHEGSLPILNKVYSPTLS